MPGMTDIYFISIIHSNYHSLIILDEWFCTDCNQLMAEKKCQIPGCNGLGHINGRSLSHSNPRYCPRLSTSERMRFAKADGTFGTTPKTHQPTLTLGSPSQKRLRKKRMKLLKNGGGGDSETDDGASSQFSDIDDSRGAVKSRKRVKESNLKRNSSSLLKQHPPLVIQQQQKQQKQNHLNWLHEDIDLEAAVKELFGSTLTAEQASVKQSRPQREDLELFESARDKAKVSN